MSVPAETDTAGRAGRLDSLTALRFFAALAIVFYHSWWPFTGHQNIGRLEYAYTAVGFFFTLSGVVLAWSWRAGTGVVIQWRRRAARIFPLHWLMLGAVVAIYLIQPEVHPPRDTKAALVTNAALLQAWPPFTHLLTFNFPSWSLSSEMFFYLLFPFLIRGLVRLPARRLILLAGGLAIGYVLAALTLHRLALPSVSDGSALGLPPLQFLKFAGGACIGAALAKGWRPRIPLWVGMGVLVAAVVALPRLSSPSWAWAPVLRGGPLFADLVLVVPTFLVVTAAAGTDLRAWRRTGRMGPLGRLRPLVRLGDWSFALYMVHAPLLYVSYAVRSRYHVTSAPGPAWLAAYLVACIVLSGLLHVLFEHPVERWIRRHEPRRRAGRDDRNSDPVAADRVPAPSGQPQPEVPAV